MHSVQLELLNDLRVAATAGNCAVVWTRSTGLAEQLDELAADADAIERDAVWSQHFVGGYRDEHPDRDHAAFWLLDLVRGTPPDLAAKVAPAALDVTVARESQPSDTLNLAMLKAACHRLLSQVGRYGSNAQDANWLFDGAFAAAAFALGLKAGFDRVPTRELIRPFREALAAFGSFWKGGLISVDPKVIRDTPEIGPIDPLPFIDHLVSQVLAEAKPHAPQPPLHVAAAMLRHAVAWLLGEQGDYDVGAHRSLPILFVSIDGSEIAGTHAQLEVFRLRPPAGCAARCPVFFPDTVALGLTSLDDKWRHSFDDAHTAAMAEARRREGACLDVGDLGWRVCFRSPEIHLDERAIRRKALLAGGSASGAAGVLQVASVLHGDLDTGMFLTALLDEKGFLYDVGGKAFKIPAAGRVFREEEWTAGWATGLQFQPRLLYGERFIETHPRYETSPKSDSAGAEFHDCQASPSDAADAKSQSTAQAPVRAADHVWWRGLGEKSNVTPVPCRTLGNAFDEFTKETGAVRAYLTEVIKECSQVPGYFPKEIRDLPQIHVHVRVRTEPMPHDLASTKIDEAGRRSGEDDGGSVYRHRRAEEHGVDEQDRGELIADWGNEMRPHLQRGFLVGDPGGGKSWFIKTEARTTATVALEQLAAGVPLDLLELPVMARLADLAESLLIIKKGGQPSSLRDVLQAWLASKRDRYPSAAAKRVLAALGTPRCRLFLDAWDEVSHRSRDNDAPSPMMELGHRLREWFNRNPQTRFLITSRLVGVPDEPFWRFDRDSTADRQLELQPFTLTQTHAFVRNFFGVRSELAAEVCRQLDESPQLFGLAEVPLLLSFLCVYIHEQQRAGTGKSSRQQFAFNVRELVPNDLYKFIVTRLLRQSWHDKSGNYNPGNEGHLLRIAEMAAFYLLRAGKQQFRVHELQNTLIQARTEDGLQITDESMSEFISAVTGRDALIMPAGVGDDPTFLFLHLTIQEYLVVRYLMKRPWDQVQAILSQYWDHPDFAEVWRLYALEGRKSIGHIDRMIATVYANQHPLDRSLLRHVQTAIRWLGQAEFPSCPGSHAQGLAVLDATQCFAKRAANNKRFDMLRTFRLWRAQMKLDSYVRKCLLLQLGDYDRDVRVAAAQALAAQAGDSEVRKALLDVLDDVDPVVCSAAARALAAQAGDSQVRKTLLERLVNNRGIARRDAAEALMAQAGNREVWRAFLDILGDHSFDVANAVAKALAPMTGNPEVRKALLERLDDDDPHVREAAARVLASRADDPQVRQAFLDWLRDGSSVPDVVVKALAPQARAPDVQRTFLDRLGDETYSVRDAVAKALAPMAANHEVRKALLDRLDYRNNCMRVGAVNALAAQAGDAQVRQALLNRLRDNDPYVRIAIVQALVAHLDDPSVRKAILEPLNDRNGQVRVWTAYTLGVRANNPQVRQALLDRLDDSDVDLRSAIVQALVAHLAEPDVRHAFNVRLDSHYLATHATTPNFVTHVGDPLVRKVLLDSLETDTSKYQRYWREPAIEALGGHAEDPEVRRVLLKQLSKFNPCVSAVKALAAQAGDSEVRRALLDCVGMYNSPLRLAAVRALAAQAGDPQVQQALLDSINADCLQVVEAATKALKRWIVQTKHNLN